MKPLLNVREAAQLLGVAPATLYEWCAAHFIPHVKVGSRTLFAPEDLEHWLQERRIQEEGPDP